MGVESDSHEYEPTDAVHQAERNMVGSGAVGREDYLDCGGSNRDDADEGNTRDEQSL